MYDKTDDKTHDRTICLLTTRDFAALEDLLARGDVSVQLASLIRRKLGDAMLLFPDDVPPNVATLDSRIRFRVDDGAADTRTLVRDERRSVVGMTLRIDTLRGAALLGLESGSSALFERTDGAVETVHLEGVEYQPEAAARQAARQNVVRLETRRPVAPRRFLPPGGFGDDPGPGAA